MDDLSGMLKGLEGSGPGDDATVAGDFAAGRDPLATIGALTGAIEAGGGIDGLLERLRAGGLGPAVDSWIGTDANAQVEPQRLGAALGDDQVQRLSSASGLDVTALLPLLAAFLPRIVDMLTPGGQVPTGGLDGAVRSGTMPDLGGLLGGLAGAVGSGGAGEADLGDLLGGLGGVLGGDRDR